jgi:hypothetical protein
VCINSINVFLNKSLHNRIITNQLHIDLSITTLGNNTTGNLANLLVVSGFTSTCSFTNSNVPT